MNTKSKIKTEIPQELRDVFREVIHIIDESDRDPDYSIDFGDAIQVPPTLVGGRIGDAKRPFEFTFRNTLGVLWAIQLSQLEIEDIADGMMEAINLYNCDNCSSDYFTTDSEYECKCDIKLNGRFGNFEFPAAIAKLAECGIDGVSESSNREDVVKILGEPSISGGDVKSPTIGYIAPWVKYLRTDYQLRFEFGRNKTLRLVSLLEPNWKPGK